MGCSVISYIYIHIFGIAYVMISFEFVEGNTLKRIGSTDQFLKREPYLGNLWPRWLDCAPLAVTSKSWKSNFFWDIGPSASSAHPTENIISFVRRGPTMGATRDVRIQWPSSNVQQSHFIKMVSTWKTQGRQRITRSTSTVLFVLLMSSFWADDSPRLSTEW